MAYMNLINWFVWKQIIIKGWIFKVNDLINLDCIYKVYYMLAIYFIFNKDYICTPFLMESQYFNVTKN